MTYTMEALSGNGQGVERGERFAPLVVRLVSEEDGNPVGGAVVSYFVDDSQGTGTDFHGGSPVRVTSTIDGTATTDVPLVAGDSAGQVTIRVTADSANCTLKLTVR
ncbi:hypothetical protein [Streptomyces minutiscleroticus]|uniref:Big-1 domain-containing protein n=1 Tax=Streptomyces minutiscleroticus TaxID=68238 RepID=A0A918KNL4_9ACTN|nr:hypothetical protein [Streptomyces minutiscleroticus]GGX69167.1 hypothetical protein GCM10010358_24470 [Streptomyces minutiscleroticus]